jgi:spore germination cell wall hydrolase CwlJ-like protein
MRHILIALALIPTAVDISTQQSCTKDEFASIYTAKHKRATGVTIAGATVSSAQTKEVKCLATMIYGEARSEPVRGQVAVAYTAINRAVNKSVCQVVLAPMQYSIFNNNPELRAIALSPVLEPTQHNTIDEDSWDQAMQTARLVIKSKIADPTGGATHYIADKVMKLKGYRYPKWSKQFTQVADINNHRFFKKGGLDKQVAML